MATGNTIIERAQEDFVMGLVAHGASHPEIVEALRARGVEVSRSTVRRFVANEARARAAARHGRAASAAAKITAEATGCVVDHIQQLKDATRAMHRMAVDGYRFVRVPGEDEKCERVAAGTQVKACEALKATAGYLLELAGADAPQGSELDAKRIRQILDEELLGRARTTNGSGEQPEEAPPSDDEHQPPVMH